MYIQLLLTTNGDVTIVVLDIVSIPVARFLLLFSRFSHPALDMLSASRPGKRVQMCHLERALPATSWPVSATLPTALCSSRGISRVVVVVLPLSCIRWDRIMRLNRGERSGLSWQYVVSAVAHA